MVFVKLTEELEKSKRNYLELNEEAFIKRKLKKNLQKANVS